MLLSVIVPVYKVEPYLDICVQSIVRQTYQNLEILLVDDGSPDCCPQLCDNWAARDNRIKVIHKPNGGLSDARNVGIAAAMGELLAFVDADDTLHPQMYETLLLAMLNSNADIALCDFRRTDKPSQPEEPLPTEIVIQIPSKDEMLRSVLVEYVVAWNKIYRRSLFSGVRYPKGRLYEDEFVAHQLLWKAHRVAWVKAELYYYFQRNDSIMRDLLSLQSLDSLDAMRERTTFFIERGRLDLAVYSLDTLLALTEKLCSRQAEYTESTWVFLRKSIAHDRLHWHDIANRCQKMRWRWLAKDPAGYPRKWTVYNRFACLLNPPKKLVRKLLHKSTDKHR